MSTILCDDSSKNLIDKACKQSHYLIGLLDKAYEEAARGDSIENMGLLIDALVDYATDHFHLVEHMSWNSSETGTELKAYAEKVSELQVAYYSKRHSVSLRALTFLINWIQHYKLRIEHLTL